MKKLKSKSVHLNFIFIVLIFMLLVILFNIDNNVLMDIDYIKDSYKIQNDTLFNEFGYTMVVLSTDEDCMPCLEILKSVTELNNLYTDSSLRIFGIFQKNHEDNNKTINCFPVDFPIIETEKLINIQNLQTPLILLFDDKGIIKYVRTSTPSRGEHIIFFNVIEQIL